MEGDIATALNAAKEFNFEGDTDLKGVLQDYFTSPDVQNNTSDEESEESEGKDQQQAVELTATDLVTKIALQGT